MNPGTFQVRHEFMCHPFTLGLNMQQINLLNLSNAITNTGSIFN